MKRWFCKNNQKMKKRGPNIRKGLYNLLMIRKDLIAQPEIYGSLIYNFQSLSNFQHPACAVMDQILTKHDLIVLCAVGGQRF